MDASPAVQDGDINGLVNAFIGQASTLTHRDSLHYDITGKWHHVFNDKDNMTISTDCEVISCYAFSSWHKFKR